MCEAQMTPETVTYSVCNTPTAAQRRRLVDLLRQVQARRLTLRPARRLTLCYRKVSAPDE
jgi:hypothetical protein